MNFKTLAKNALWVGGGIFLGGVVNSQVIQPNLSSLEINDTLKALVGPAVLTGGAFLAQDMLPRKVVYGMIGMAGYSVLGNFMGGLMPENQAPESQTA